MLAVKTEGKNCRQPQILIVSFYVFFLVENRVTKGETFFGDPATLSNTTTGDTCMLDTASTNFRVQLKQGYCV